MFTFRRQLSALASLALVAVLLPNVAVADDQVSDPTDPTEQSESVATEQATTEAPSEEVSNSVPEETTEPTTAATSEETEEETEPSPTVGRVRANNVGIAALGKAHKIGHGWTANATYALGNFDSRGGEDVALVRPNGDLLFYPRNSALRFGGHRKIGHGWNNIIQLFTNIDWDGDGHTDIVGLRFDGNLYLYRGNGRGGFASTRIFGWNWLAIDRMVILPAGANGQPAFLAQVGDTVYEYPTNGRGTFQSRFKVNVPGGLEGVVGTGALENGRSSLLRVNGSELEIGRTADGRSFDWVPLAGGFAGTTIIGTTAVRNGATTLDMVAPNKDFLNAPLSIQQPNRPKQQPRRRWAYLSSTTTHKLTRGWPTKDFYGVGDATKNGNADVAMITGDGRFWIFENRNSHFAPRRQIGSGWHNLIDIHTGFDFDGDGNVDIVGRGSDGALLLYRFKSNGTFGQTSRIGTGWGQFKKLLVLRNGPNKNPVIYALNGDGTMLMYQTDGRGGILPPSQVAGKYTHLLNATAVDDWDKDGYSDVLAKGADNDLYLYRQLKNGGFSGPARVGYNWQDIRVVVQGNVDGRSQTLHAIHKSGTHYKYVFRYTGPNKRFTPVGMRRSVAPKVQVSGTWNTHPITWYGQPNDIACGPTSMMMVLNYKGAHRSKYDGKSLSIAALSGKNYADLGSGNQGGTSWEHRNLSRGLNRWLGTNAYRQTSFPSGAAFDRAVRNSFVTGNPVLVDTIETWNGPHYNGHYGDSSHIVVAYRYNYANGTVGFVDPAGPGSALRGYSASRRFDYNNASRFATNFLGNYGYGGHGMVY